MLLLRYFLFCIGLGSAAINKIIVLSGAFFWVGRVMGNRLIAGGALIANVKSASATTLVDYFRLACLPYYDAPT